MAAVKKALRRTTRELFGGACSQTQISWIKRDSGENKSTVIVKDQRRNKGMKTTSSDIKHEQIEKNFWLNKYYSEGVGQEQQSSKDFVDGVI